MKEKHRYIWIFGGISVMYLLIMVAVGKLDHHEPDIQDEEYIVSEHVEENTASPAIHTERPAKTEQPAESVSPEGSADPEMTNVPEGAKGYEVTNVPEDPADPEMTNSPAGKAVETGVPSGKPKTETAGKTEKKVKKTAPPVFYGYKNVSKERRSVVNLAKKYVGKISYYWGGKPSGKDITGKTDPHRLDCSGFIQFIFSKVSGKRVASVGATVSIQHLQKIGKESLKPGDLGLKRGTGSLYFDADGKSYYEPSLAEYANEKHVKSAKKQIEKLENRIAYADHVMEEKKDKIETWRERRKKVLKKAREIGKIRVSKSGKTFSVITVKEEEDEETEEMLEIYQESFEDYGERMTKAKNSIRLLRRKKENYKKEIAQEKRVIKKYDRDVKKRIDHVGIYCGKDKKGKEIWCHCSSSGHGVVWEHTDIFRYYYRYFNQ